MKLKRNTDILTKGIDTPPLPINKTGSRSLVLPYRNGLEVLSNTIVSKDSASKLLPTDKNMARLHSNTVMDSDQHPLEIRKEWFSAQQDIGDVTSKSGSAFANLHPENTIDLSDSETDGTDCVVIYDFPEIDTASKILIHDSVSQDLTGIVSVSPSEKLSGAAMANPTEIVPSPTELTPDDGIGEDSDGNHVNTFHDPAPEDVARVES